MNAKGLPAGWLRLTGLRIRCEADRQPQDAVVTPVTTRRDDPAEG